MINPKKHLLQNKNNTLLQNFLQNGYVVIKALNQSDFNKLKNSVIDRINTKIKKKFSQKKI